MKKISILAILAVTTTLASAITTTVVSGITGANALSGESAYSWGISVPLASGQTVSSATLSFNNITLTAANSTGRGILYSDLLNDSQTGIHTFTDNDAVGDYFAGQYSSGNIVSLGYETFARVGTTHSWDVTFSQNQLAALNLFLTGGGVFNFGFDPDCHYTVCCISFCYTTTPVSTPDVATTIYMLGLGLVGLEVSRRKLALAKAK